MNHQIFVVGRPAQDVFITCPDLTVDPSQTLIQLPLGDKLACQSTTVVGGNAANVAVSLARANCQPKFIGRAGNDQAGRGIRDWLLNQNVDVDGFCLVDGEQTSLSVILLTENGERTILAHPGHGIESHDWQAQLEEIGPNDWVYLSSIGDSQTLASAIKQIAARGGRIALNPTGQVLHQPQPLIEVLDQLSLLIANREETSCLFVGQTPAELATAASRVVPLVVVTDGPQGSVTASDGQLYAAGLYQPQSPVVDRTGAGDAFAGGFLAGLMHDQPIATCLTWAAANSTSVVGQTGAQTGILSLSQQELEPLAINQTAIGQPNLTSITNQ